MADNDYSELIFVFDSLKRNQYLNYLLSTDGKIIENIAKIYNYAMFNIGNRPIIVQRQDKDNKIFGEIWAISKERLLLLDQMYCFNHVKRKIEAFRLDNDKHYNVIVYEFRYVVADITRQVQSGSWNGDHSIL